MIMNDLSDSCKNEFKRKLDLFRTELLLSDLFRGLIVVTLFFILYLTLFHIIIRFFSITVLFKTVVYFLFLGGGTLLVCLFIVYPVIQFFLSLNLKNNRLLHRLLKNKLVDDDLFVSLYDLAFHDELVTGNSDLKKAAFIQKYKFGSVNNLFTDLIRKKLYGILVFTVIIISSFFIFNRSLVKVFVDLADYKVVENNNLNIEFRILNESLNVEYGKPFKLQARIQSDYVNFENVFICFGGGEFLMDKRDSIYVYHFDNINNDLSFYFKVNTVESNTYKIKVLPSPEITDYEITYSPPQYTGIKPEVLKNIVDFRILYGSVLKFKIEYSSIDTLVLRLGNTERLIDLKSKNSTDFSCIVKSSGEYALYGSNKDFIRKNLINFNVNCIPDLYPGIKVTEMQDSLKNSLYYFYGVVNDDYGFSELRFGYSINGQGNTVIPIEIVRNINTQEFYFSFDFAEFAGMDRTKISYYFEIFDNDAISGPKSTRSDLKDYSVPDLDMIFESNVEADNTVNASLKEAEKLAKEIVAGVKDLQRKMLDNSVDNWEKQQLSKDIVEKKQKLDKLLNTVKEESLKKASLNQNFTKQDSLLLDKQKKVQDLLDKVMDDEMKKLMDEFSKLSDEFSKDKFQNLDEKMKLSFDQMSEELDRNIELLKRFQIEERHDLISQQMEKLKEKQQELGKQNDEKFVSKDSLTEKSQDLKDNLDNIKQNYDNLLKDNKDLQSPYDLKDLDKQFDELSKKLDQQKEDLQKGKEDKKLSDEIKQKMDELAEQMQKQKEQNFNDISLPESDIELIIQNILLISLSQEDLLNEFPSVSSQSARYNELGRIQDLKKLEFKIVKDSLSSLAKSNLMLASVLSDKFYDLEIKFGLLPGYIQDNKRSELKKEQQFIINYLNDVALVLTDALQKDKEGASGSGSGSKGKKGSKPNGNQKNKGNGEKDGYGDMKKFQQGLKKQLEDMVSRMKNGENGKPMQQGVSRLIRENELFKQSLNDFISKSGALSNSERQLLNEIQKLLEDNIKDIANYSISNNLINRNNQIYNKLLMSEKASKEREEYEEKRKSATAKKTTFEKPALYLDVKKKNGLIKTDLRKSDIKLNVYFKNIYNNYYIKLGDE